MTGYYLCLFINVVYYAVLIWLTNAFTDKPLVTGSVSEFGFYHRSVMITLGYVF